MIQCVGKERQTAILTWRQNGSGDLGPTQVFQGMRRCIEGIRVLIYPGIITENIRDRDQANDLSTFRDTDMASGLIFH